MRSLNDKLLYEVMTSFNSDIFMASTEQTFDNTTIANICSFVNHKIENSQSVYSHNYGWLTKRSDPYRKIENSNVGRREERELEQYLAKLPYSVKIADETSFNRSGSGIQIVIHAEVPFEEGRFEKEIISEIEKFAEGKTIELVVKLSIVSSLHKGRRLKTGKKK